MGDTFKTIFPILSWIMDQMAPTVAEDAGQTSSQGVKTNFRTTEAYIPLVYGLRKVGGNDVFMASVGTNNEYLWIVQTLSEGECEGINYADGEYRIFLDGELVSEYGSYVNYYFSTGTSASSGFGALETDYPNYTDTLRHTCAIAFKLEWDEDRESGDYNFQGIPERLIELKGLKVIDFRTPTPTAGWTDNPVLCLYDYMTNTRYGMGLASSKFDTTSWTAAANYCDTKNFTLNYVVESNRKCGDIINDILMHFRGQLVWYDGKFYCRYADTNYESVVYTITDRDILVSEDGIAQVSMAQPGRFSKPKMIEIEFYDAEKDYTKDVISIGDDDQNPEKLTLSGCTDRTMAGILGTYQLERLQLDRILTGTFRDHLVILDPHDLVYVNSSAMSIEDTLMRVIETSVNPDGLVTLTLQYENANLYNDVYNEDITEVYQSSLPDPRDAPPGVSNVQYSEQLRYHRGRTYTDLNITFDAPTYIWWDHIEVWISTTTAAASAFEYKYDTRNDFKIDNIREGDEIYVALRSVSIYGAKQNFDDAYKINTTIEGKTAAPTSLTALAAITNENTVNLYADEPADPDIEGYEFRLGDSWSGGVYLAFNRRPVYSLHGVKPGTHSFWANTLGTNGVYGDTPKSATVVIPEPDYAYTENYTAQPDWTTPLGTFNNTEIVSYGGDDYLAVTHSPALTGTYLSETLSGASAVDFVWIDTDLVVVGAGTQWQDKFVGTPCVSGTTWAEGGAVTKTWAEIFELQEAPSVNIWLYYSTSDPPTSYYQRMEILSARFATAQQYFRIYISITDPSAEVYAYIGQPTLNAWN